MSRPISIRRYKATDIDEVVTVWADSWNATGLRSENRYGKADYRARLDGEGRGWDMYVAIDDSLVGFVALQLEENWLRQLFVAPAHQRTGIGGRLMGIAKAVMRDGFWLRTDEENLVARRFYDLMGLEAGECQPHPTLGHRVVTYSWSGPAETTLPVVTT